MRVLDMNAAAGYYAELLARVVGPRVTLIAHNHPRSARARRSRRKTSSGATAATACRTRSSCS